MHIKHLLISVLKQPFGKSVSSPSSYALSSVVCTNAGPNKCAQVDETGAVVPKNEKYLRFQQMNHTQFASHLCFHTCFLELKA